jgi:hypothetical protein
MFAYVSTSNLTIEQAPVTSRDDARVLSLHRTREAAEARAAKDLRALRRQPGQANSYLLRAIVEV